KSKSAGKPALSQSATLMAISSRSPAWMVELCRQSMLPTTRPTAPRASANRPRKIGKAARNPENGFDISYFGDPRFTGWSGGGPAFKDGKVIGAVAVAGLPETGDVEIAEMAVALLTS